MPLRRIIGRIAIGLVALLVVIQLVPYGRDHANPTPTQEAKWPDGKGQQLFADACGDCHSDHTDWPFYSNVAPISWLVENDVKEGRGRFNVSEWDKPQPDVGEVTEAISEGEMPPLQYKPLHPKSRLSDAEKQALIGYLSDLYAADPPAATRG